MDDDVLHNNSHHPHIATGGHHRARSDSVSSHGSSDSHSGSDSDSEEEEEVEGLFTVTVLPGYSQVGVVVANLSLANICC